jgi:hypothetical protein
VTMVIRIRTPRIFLAATLLAACMGFVPTGAPALWAKTRIDADKVYYGDARRFVRPAQVDALKVYRQIPAHKEIAERKLTRKDPDYWPLLRKASQAFSKALRKVCQDKGYDLVGEVDAIAIDGKEIPEITEAVIEALADRPKQARDADKDKAAAAPKPPAPPPVPEATPPPKAEAASPIARG